MPSSTAHRPIGFGPGEISSLVNSHVVAQHVEEAAFLWTQRNRAIGEPHYSLRDLAVLDERVEAHLDGVRVAGDVGWTLARDRIADGAAGELFVATVLAFGAGERSRMREALLDGDPTRGSMDGLIAALGWLGFSAISPWIVKLLGAQVAAYRTAGIAACAIHRQDPGRALPLALDDPDPLLRARALRAVGEIKRGDCVAQARSRLKDDDEAVRFWAAWALVLNHERDGVAELAKSLDPETPRGRQALQLVLRAVPVDESRHMISALARDPSQQRAAVMGAGVIGDPASVPWLVRQMESEDLARLAGEAFSMITGVDLAYHGLDRDPPPSDVEEELSIDKITALDYESNLRWPSLDRVAQWWNANGGEFSPGARYLGGQPITHVWLRELLGSGKQRQRAAAAIELALLDRAQPYFEVRQRGQWQEARLVAWNS